MSGLDLLLSQRTLWHMLLVATVAGILLGVLCDGLFILRLLVRDPRSTQLVPPSKSTPAGPVFGQLRRCAYAALRFLCDFLAVVFATVVLMLLCYYTSDGQLRAPAIFGMSAGFLGYHYTVSRGIRRLLTVLSQAILRCLRFLWMHTLGRLWLLARNAVLRRIRNALTARRIARLARDATGGFDIHDEPNS